MSDTRELGELCCYCQRRYLTVYRIPDEGWERITGRKDGRGLLCPACCDALMKEAGLNPYWEATFDNYPTEMKGGDAF